MNTTTRPIITTQRPTTAEHYAIQTNHDPEPGTRTPRSKASHRCILIVGSGPAFGRPQPTLRAVDLALCLFKIVMAGSSC